MPQKIIVLGAGGNCIEMLDTLDDINDAGPEPVYECVGFLDDNRRLWGTSVSGVPVLGGLSSAAKYPDCVFINGIGNESMFWKKPDIIATTGLPPDRFETVIHPTASVSRRASLGRGVMVFQHVTVTATAQVGDHVFIRPNAVVSHDVQVGDHTIIAAGARLSGRSKIGACCFIGLNSAVRGDTTVGNQSLVGMGSVVVRDVPENSVVVGNPARHLRPMVLQRAG